MLVCADTARKNDLRRGHLHGASFPASSDRLPCLLENYDMRIKKKTLVGRIDDKGNLIAPLQLLGDFCNLNKGRSVIIRIDVQPQEASEKLRNYVFGYVVPEMQRILHDNGEDYTREQTFNYLKSLCPVFLDEEYLGDGKWKQRKKEWEELDVAEAVEFCAWVQRLASIEFNQVIQDPQ